MRYFGLDTWLFDKIKKYSKNSLFKSHFFTSLLFSYVWDCTLSEVCRFNGARFESMTNTVCENKQLPYSCSDMFGS